MEATDGVKKLLHESKGISVQEEWLDACVQWIIEEEVQYDNIKLICIDTHQINFTFHAINQSITCCIIYM